MSLRFKIGPALIEFKANSAPHDGFELYYRDFLYEGNETSDLIITVHAGLAPEKKEGRLVMDLTENWSLYEQPQGYRLEVLEQIEFKPKLVALIHADWRHIDAYPVPLPYAMPNHINEGWYLGDIMEPVVQWWLTSWLAEREQGILFHGAAISFARSGIAFVGPSGAGKTTLSRWCRDTVAATVLNDERIIVWREASGWKISGSPWPGELRQVSALTASLSRFCVLTQAPTNEFVPLVASRFLERMLQEAFHPLWDSTRMANLLAVACRLTKEIPCGELRCQNQQEAARYVESLSERVDEMVSSV
jgi:hypothetical protein